MSVLPDQNAGSQPGHQHGLVAALVTAVLVVSGAAVVVVAVTRPGSPQAPVAAAASPTTRGPTTHPPAEPGQPAPLVLPASRPVSIAIPAIDVTASVMRLGRAADNTIEVPQPRPALRRRRLVPLLADPGELGPSVIVGHVDSAKNGPSVFWRLGTLRKDDRVKVTRTDGSVATFEVDEVRLFRKKAFPTELVYGNTDHAALRLITCGGPFDSAGHYRDNVVVLASLVAG